MIKALIVNSLRASIGFKYLHCRFARLTKLNTRASPAQDQAPAPRAGIKGAAMWRGKSHDAQTFGSLVLYLIDSV